MAVRSPSVGSTARSPANPSSPAPRPTSRPASRHASPGLVSRNASPHPAEGYASQATSRHPSPHPADQSRPASRRPSPGPERSEPTSRHASPHPAEAGYAARPGLRGGSPARKKLTWEEWKKLERVKKNSKSAEKAITSPGASPAGSSLRPSNNHWDRGGPR